MCVRAILPSRSDTLPRRGARRRRILRPHRRGLWQENSQAAQCLPKRSLLRATLHCSRPCWWTRRGLFLLSCADASCTRLAALALTLDVAGTRPSAMAQRPSSSSSSSSSWSPQHLPPHGKMRRRRVARWRQPQGATTAEVPAPCGFSQPTGGRRRARTTRAAAPRRMGPAGWWAPSADGKAGTRWCLRSQETRNHHCWRARRRVARRSFGRVSGGWALVGPRCTAPRRRPRPPRSCALVRRGGRRRLRSAPHSRTCGADAQPL